MKTYETVNRPLGCDLFKKDGSCFELANVMHSLKISSSYHSVIFPEYYRKVIRGFESRPAVASVDLMSMAVYRELTTRA